MIKRMIGVFLIYGVFVASVIHALGFTQVDMSNGFRALLTQANVYFNEFKFEIPAIPQIPDVPHDINLATFLNSVISFLNFVVGLLNFVVMALNGVLAILQFAFWFVGAIITFANNGYVEIEDAFEPVSIQPLFPITDFPVFPIW